MLRGPHVLQGLSDLVGTEERQGEEMGAMAGVLFPLALRAPRAPHNVTFAHSTALRHQRHQVLQLSRSLLVRIVSRLRSPDAMDATLARLVRRPLGCA